MLDYSFFCMIDNCIYYKQYDIKGIKLNTMKGYMRTLCCITLPFPWSEVCKVNVNIIGLKMVYRIGERSSYFNPFIRQNYFSLKQIVDVWRVGGYGCAVRAAEVIGHVGVWLMNSFGILTVISTGCDITLMVSANAASRKQWLLNVLASSLLYYFV